ncbi:MAG: diacylglycerol kinase family protein [Ruminococcus sp.]|nr:diacylglycerol kinase family protein [Ruminococcus sp.]
MYYFIVNPVSRSGKGMEVWEQTEKTLIEKDIPYKVYFTQHTGHGTSLAKGLYNKIQNQTLVIIGGDGTVNEVLTGLPMDGTYTIGYIPVGSGNDFARGLGLPTDPIIALENILSDKPASTIDIGTLKTNQGISHFGISSGIGYDAAVCEKVATSRLKKILNKIHLGNLVYAYAAVRSLFGFHPCDMDIEIDDFKKLHYKKVYLIVAMNLPYEGGGFRMCPEADATNKELHFLVVRGVPKIALLFLFPTAYFGKHLMIPGIFILKGKKLRVHSKQPQCVHRDGEVPEHTDTLTWNIEEQILHIKR